LGSLEQFAEEVLIPQIENDENEGNSAFNEWVPPAYGLYGKWLREWLDYFGRDNLLVLSYDELDKNPSKFRERVASFIFPKMPISIIEDLTKVIKDSFASNTQSCHLKTNTMACSIQHKLEAKYAKSTREFYNLINSRPGPPMEQSPFPAFARFDQCTVKISI
jgi:hypothetical protein